MRIKRKAIRESRQREYEPCIICGYDLYTEQHHYKDGICTLCPGHHRMITFGEATVEYLIEEKKKK